MKIINKFLTEFYPSHPEDTVIKNKFYPTGLREVQIYNYYLSVKNALLEWINDHRVAFLLRLDESRTVLIRNQRGKPIHLTKSNFEDLITGRTNCIYVTQDELTDHWVIDIDVGSNLGMTQCKKVHDILLHKLDMKNIDSLGIKNYESILTSPKGIHIIGYLNHASNIDLLRDSLKIELQRICNEVNPKSKIKFTTDVKGRPANTINFDLSSMHPNSLHIAKYSLTKEGLICGDVKEGLKKVQG